LDFPLLVRAIIPIALRKKDFSYYH